MIPFIFFETFERNKPEYSFRNSYLIQKETSVNKFL